MANKIKTIKSHDIEKLESDVNQFLESNNINDANIDFRPVVYKDENNDSCVLYTVIIIYR